MANYKYVKVVDKGYEKILRELGSVDDMVVDVGIFEGETNSKGASIAEYATANEYGVESINLPSRAFMAQTFDSHNRGVSIVVGNQIKAVIDQKKSIQSGLDYVGVWYQQKIQNTITNVDFLPRLKQSTILSKKGSTKTLIDSSAMINAVTYAVRYNP